MKQKLIGRLAETNALKTYLDSPQSEFIAVYGRRRVGKTFFVRNIIRDKADFMFTGMENASLSDQLNNFFYSLRHVYPNCNKPTSWIDAFDQLRTFLENRRSSTKIVFIDELPWLDTVRSKFVSALEWFWNGWASSRDDIKLIVCGSATSWMIDNLLNNRGGLHNRVTHRIHIKPFVLNECEEYFKVNNFGYRRQEIAELYMVFGGVPYYYSLMDKGKSVAQNIDCLIFSQDGELKSEFDNLYRSLFKKPSDHIKIISALSSKGKGLTRAELLKATKLNNNAKFTETLDELEKCGFIRQYLPFESTKKHAIYQIVDPFTLFHFKFERQNVFHDDKFWTNSINTPSTNAWKGYAFEMLCLNHIEQIKCALGIAGVQSNICSWKDSGRTEGRGAQIDLLIDRADLTVNLCEMKYSPVKYSITKSDYDNFTNKIDLLFRVTGTKKSVIFTMITPNGIVSNHYSGLVQAVITIDDLFA